MRDLRNCVAVVTGASIGIGRAVSIALAREGCRVILVARGSVGLQQTFEEISNSGGVAAILETDLAVPAAVEQLAARLESDYGRVDILWNGAFGWLDGPLEESTSDELVAFLDASVRGPIILTKSLMPLLLNAESPHVLNVSADWEFPQMSGISAFIAAKRALAGFGIALQKEKNGILRVTNIHPADVASKDSSISEEVSLVLQRHGRKMIPLVELADLVVFILKLEATIVHQLDLKPLNQEVGMTFL